VPGNAVKLKRQQRGRRGRGRKKIKVNKGAKVLRMRHRTVKKAICARGFR